MTQQLCPKARARMSETPLEHRNQEESTAFWTWRRENQNIIQVKTESRSLKGHRIPGWGTGVYAEGESKKY
jgi:hypothetical protein